MLIIQSFEPGPLDSKEIIESILKETNPDYSLEGLMLKLELQYFGHLVQRADSLEKTLVLQRIEGRRRRRRQGETVGWCRCLSGQGFAGSLACCSPWQRKELNRTWRQKNSQSLCDTDGSGWRVTAGSFWTCCSAAGSEG